MRGDKLQWESNELSESYLTRNLDSKAPANCSRYRYDNDIKTNRSPIEFMMAVTLLRIVPDSRTIFLYTL